MTMALAIRWPVNTHVASSVDTDRLPALRFG